MQKIEDLYWFDAIMQWADKYNIHEYDINKMGIPKDKDTLYNLTELDLSEYNIKDIPQEIKYLQNLKELDLNYCSLESIPSEIGNLFNLDCLSLGAGKDNLDLPESIKNLKNLKYVSLCGNFSKKSIELLLDLPLIFLEITYNDTLTTLPKDFFDRLKNLERLYISNTNSLVLTKEQWEYALSLRKPYYVYASLNIIPTTRRRDIAEGFRYFSYGDFDLE